MKTKYEIIEKLIKDGHLSLQQALILLDEESPAFIFLDPQPWNMTTSQPYPPVDPLNPYRITCSNDTVN